MEVLRCPVCGALALIETLECGRCRTPIGLHLPSFAFLASTSQGALVDGAVWHPCVNRSWGCNWLASAEEESGRCFACRLIRRRPASDDTIALERLGDLGYAVRRLVVQLATLGLPVEPYWRTDGGLAFDLLSSLDGETVIIGHSSGVITIDLAETIDARREAIRARLGEPYRTTLGHLRHEIGHYYQERLVDSPSLWRECRALFGDERASYADAIDRHYLYGAPATWADSFISEYATMHPWEDFAETFAHYLHITGTLAVAAAAGTSLRADGTTGAPGADVVPRLNYVDVEFGRALEDWYWLSLMLNRVNRAMGHRDLYPFVIPRPVAEKLAFVHRLIGEGPPAETRPAELGIAPATSRRTLRAHG